MALQVDPGDMLFSELVGLLDEPNMCSGGFHTIHDILRAAPWLATPGLRWLEVGSNTGFSCLELASLLDASVVGVDVNVHSNEHARRKAGELGLANVAFLDGDGTSLPFDDGAFDVVFCSNVTSFIPDRAAAAAEYFRVVRPLGFVIAVPIYYVQRPPRDLVDRVEAAIGAQIDIVDVEGWVSLFTRAGGTLIHETRYRYEAQHPHRIADYAEQVAAQPSNAALDEGTRSAAAVRLRVMFELFDENLTFAGFSTLIFRKGMPTDWPILHRATLPGERS